MTDVTPHTDDPQLLYTVGTILNAASVPEILDQCQQALMQVSGGTIAVDLTNTEIIDSVGVSLLVTVYRECTIRQATMQVIVRHEVVKKVLGIMQLDKIIDIVEG